MAQVEFRSIQTTGLERRVRREYHDMPGLRLTLRQACRLWDVETIDAERAFEHLVRSGYLRRIGKYYFRADLGRLSA